MSSKQTTNTTNDETTGETFTQCTWRVIKGRKGKATQYFARLPRGTKGLRVILESKAGVVTTGTLLALDHVHDGEECWTLARDPKTAEQRAADRAKNIARNVAYWESEKGVATMARIQARAEAKQAAAPAPVAPVAQVSAVAEVTMASLLAELLAAGVDPSMAIATATATMAQLNAAPVTSAPVAPAPVVKSSTTKSSTTPKQPAKALCMACGTLDTLKGHAADTKIKVCKQCIALPGDILATRVSKQRAKEASKQQQQ